MPYTCLLNLWKQACSHHWFPHILILVSECNMFQSFYFRSLRHVTIFDFGCWYQTLQPLHSLLQFVLTPSRLPFLAFYTFPHTSLGSWLFPLLPPIPQVPMFSQCLPHARLFPNFRLGCHFFSWKLNFLKTKHTLFPQIKSLPHLFYIWCFFDIRTQGRQPGVYSPVFFNPTFSISSLLIPAAMSLVQDLPSPASVTAASSDWHPRMHIFHQGGLSKMKSKIHIVVQPPPSCLTSISVSNITSSFCYDSSSPTKCSCWQHPRLPLVLDAHMRTLL